MNVRFDPDLIKKLKKLDIRIRKSFRERVLIFQKNPRESSLNNHDLKDPYQGLRSIDITNDYRAIYEETITGEDTFAYFSLLGIHDELYGKKVSSS